MQNNFFIDRQTLYELQLFTDDDNGQSVSGIFMNVNTEGGKQKINELFRTPLNCATDIENRQSAIKYIMSTDGFENFPVSQNHMDAIELYYYSKEPVLVANSGFVAALESIWLRVKKRSVYNKVYREGVMANLQFISRMKAFADAINGEEIPELLKNIVLQIAAFTDIPDIRSALKTIGKSSDFSFIQLMHLDKLFREVLREEYTLFIDSIYELDMYMGIAHSASKRKFTFPDIDDSVSGVDIKGLYHPFLTKAVDNDFTYSSGKNFSFLTGPNMAGKTTFLKALGVSVYLAHLGLPVPAEGMKLNLFKGLFTSLNTVDNLTKGYSYFYSEVLRVKNIAQTLHKTPKIFVIFDELFKGTNVKDAFDGSKLVVDGLCKWSGNYYVLSSHLLELGTNLKENNNVQFDHFSSSVKDNKPVFDYKLHDGLSDERIGLQIIKSEGIPQLLEPKQ